MPPAFAQKLQSLLEEHKRSIKIYSTEETQQAVRDDMKKNLGNPYPTYSGGYDSIYVEIRTEDLLIVKAELEKMGYAITKQATEGDFTPEYLCPQCKFKSDEPGLCPEHRIKLLEYSDWHAEKSKKSSAANRAFVIVVFLLVAFLLYKQLSVSHFRIFP